MVIDPEKLTVIVDTREQLPLELSMHTIRGTLPTGDYSVKGFEEYVVVERKSLPDLIGCMTTGRDRFERELQRMRSYEAKAVIVEATWEQLRRGEYRSQIVPDVATHSVCSWMCRFAIPFLFVGDRASAADAVNYFLFTSVKGYYERLRSVLGR